MARHDTLINTETIRLAGGERVAAIRVYCRCGYVSEPYLDPEDAIRDRDAHVQDVRDRHEQD